MILAALVLSCTSPRVIDGDTIVCGRTHVRIFGIDAPEIAHPYFGKYENQPGGLEAKAQMERMTKGHLVWCLPKDTDRYGRTVAICRTVTSGDLGKRLLERGLACEYTRYDHGYYRGYGQPCARRR